MAVMSLCLRVGCLYRPKIWSPSVPVTQLPLPVPLLVKLSAINPCCPAFTLQFRRSSPLSLWDPVTSSGFPFSLLAALAFHLIPTLLCPRRTPSACV